MAFSEYTGDTDIIASLGTTPAERGLTTDQFKAKFDEFAAAFVAWFNATHIVEADGHLAETSKQHLNLMTTKGDIIYQGDDAAVRLPKGGEGTVLGIKNGVPIWGLLVGGITGYTPGEIMSLTDCFNSPYASGNSATSHISLYDIDTMLLSTETGVGANNSVGGLYLIVRHGTGTTITPIITDTYVTVSIDGSYKVVVTNSSGNSVSLQCSLIKINY